MNSLRQKLFFGYATIVALVVGLSAFSFIELRLLEEKIVAGERIGKFFDIALEIRRFEKNYFLYHQAADLAENRAYVTQASATLREHAAPFAAIGDPRQVIRLGDNLDRYAMLMNHYADTVDTGGSDAAAGQIRKIGKEVLTVAEGWAKAERSALQALLDRHRQILLASVIMVGLLVIVIGHLLARRVLRPLREMEQRMEEVASGRLAKLEMSSEEREFESLTQAFNHVLRQLELRQGQLVHSEKLAALGTLLSGVAHELNNPLSNIATSTQILAEEVGAGDTATAAGDDDNTAFQRELITQIDEETWRARRIVRSLLDYARHRDFQKETLALAQLIEETLRLIRGQIPARVKVTVDVAEALTTSGDRQRLQQALLNLIRNAVDAIDGAGEVRVAARRTRDVCSEQRPGRLVVGQCASEGDVVEIEIRDSGHGIAAEHLAKVFDPFFTTKEVGKGMGLGLFIVFEIIEEHGGCIAVESEPGRGTAFMLRLPAGESAAPRRTDPAGGMT
jgi:signal transduction histidine kinase